MPKTRFIERLHSLDGKVFKDVMTFLNQKIMEERAILQLTKNTLPLKDRVEREELIASAELFLASVIRGNLEKE